MLDSLNHPSGFPATALRVIKPKLDLNLPNQGFDTLIRNNPVPESALESSDANSPDSEKRIPGAAGSAEVTDGLRKILLDAFITAGGSKGNQALRESRGWDEATYSAVKNDLATEGKLISGKGRGGSVSLAQS